MEVENMGIVEEKSGLSTYTIYMITPLDYVYIGKTNDFRQRISNHISICHNQKHRHYNIPLYKHIRELESKGEFKFDESCFHIIEEIKDCDEEGALYYERWWIEYYKWFDFKMLNERRPIRTEEEKKEQKKKYFQKYYEENKEELNRKERERYAKKKEVEKQNIIINK